MSGPGAPGVTADPRLGAIDRALSTALPSSRAAEERVWSRLRARPAPRRALPFALVATGAAAVLTVALVAAFAQGVRVDVASSGFPTLYRLEVARAELVTADATGTLSIGERHLRDPRRLSAVADASVRLQQSALPAEVEVRFLEEGQTGHGVLARTSQITGAGAGGAVITHEAPFPPLARGERMIYRVWLHVRVADGEHESARLIVEVTGAAEGQRVRYLRTQ